MTEVNISPPVLPPGMTDRPELRGCPVAGWSSVTLEAGQLWFVINADDVFAWRKRRGKMLRVYKHAHTHILSHSHTAIYLHLHYLSTQYPCASVAELFPLKLKYFLMNISACRVLSRRRLAPCKSTSLATRNKIKLIHKDDRGFLRFRIIFPVPLWACGWRGAVMFSLKETGMTDIVRFSSS